MLTGNMLQTSFGLNMRSSFVPPLEGSAMAALSKVASPKSFEKNLCQGAGFIENPWRDQQKCLDF